MLRADLEDLVTVGDRLLKFFAKNIYPPLAACTTPMPAVDEAYNFSSIDLDGWFVEVRTLNAGWFDEDELSEEVVTFSDNKTVTVMSRRPSVLMKQMQLEYEAEQGVPLENMRRELFRSLYYPKLAGCSFGDVPTSDEARAEMSEEDLQLWYDAAKRHAPELFLAFEQIAEQNRIALNDSDKKKEVTAGKS